MSMIYNKAYKVPSWVIVNLPKEDAKPIVQAFTDLGALYIKWPSGEFPETVREMAKRGWFEEVNQARPFFISADFLNVAVTQHLKKFGENKTLSGTPEVPIGRLNRKIVDDADYARLFNEIMDSETEVSLSHIFSIGEICHTAGAEQVKTFISVGPVATKALQKVSERVITVGYEGCDLDLTGVDVTYRGQNTIEFVATKLGFVK
jgi:hypothetical protein